MVIHEPQMTMRQKNQTEDIYKKPFFERLSWGFRLFMSFRGVGWRKSLLLCGISTSFLTFTEHQPRGLRPACSPKMTRPGFLASRILYVLGDFLLMDAASVLLRIIDKPYHGRPLVAQSLITFGYGLLRESSIHFFIFGII